MIKEITIDDAKKLIVENEKVFLIFSTKWCGDCAMLKLVLDKVFPQYEDQISAGKIDVDEQKAWEEYGRDFKINRIPTILGYKNGKEIFMYNDFISEPKLKELLDKL